MSYHLHIDAEPELPDLYLQEVLGTSPSSSPFRYQVIEKIMGA